MTEPSSPRALGVVAALVAGLLLSGPALAGGFHFKEVRKDGRIYVFNALRAAGAGPRRRP